MPCRPKMGKPWLGFVSKPVAHTIVSTGRCFPSTVMTPISLTWSMPDVMTLTLGEARASRYPGPGVRRLQRGGKSGRRRDRSSGLSFSRCSMSALYWERGLVWRSLFRCDFEYKVCILNSNSLRYWMYDAGSFFHARFSPSMYWKLPPLSFVRVASSFPPCWLEI